MQIPSGWKATILGEIASFIGGAQPAKEEFIYEEKEGYIRLLQIRDYKSDDYKTYIPIQKARRFCSKDDVMIGRYGPPVFQILRGLEGSYNVALMKAEPIKGVDKNFLYYLLKQDSLFNLIDRLSQRTAGQSGVDMDALKSYPVLLPPLSEQYRIATLLDKANAICLKRQQGIELAYDLLRSVFLDMFGDPITNPKGWVIKPISDVAPSKPNKDLGTKEKNKVWLLNLDQVGSNTGKILNKNFCDFSEVGSSTYWFDSSHVLYSKLRPYLNKVVLPDAIGMATSELLPLKPNPNFIVREYLVSYLRSESFVNWANGKVSGAKMPRLSSNELWKHPLPIPPIDLQKKFAKFYHKTLQTIQNQEYELINARYFYDSLTQKAFSGEL